MKTNKLFSLLVILALLLVAMPVTSAGAASTLIVDNSGACSDVTGGPYCTIQAAINASSPGDVISVAAGTYAGTLSLVNKDNLIIDGAGEGLTIIDAQSSLGYGWDLRSNGTTLSDFTFIGPTAGTYGIKVSGNSPIHAVGFTIHNVTIQNSKKTGLDINGVNGVTITDVTVNNTVSGAGIAFTDVSNATLTNITTSNNAWGSIAVMTYGRYFTGGSDNITLTNITSTEPIYTEVGNFTTPASPYPVTNFTAGEFVYHVKNLTDRPNHIYFTETEAQATAIAQFVPLFAHPDQSFVINIMNGHFIVAPGMTIQAAINAASAGNTVNVAAGTFTENLLLNKRVSLVGMGATNTIITNAAGGDASMGVIQVTASGLSDLQPVLLKDLSVLPNGRAGLSIGRFTQSTGTNVSYLSLENVAVVGTNLNSCTEQERGLYVDNTSSLLHLSIKNSSFDNLTYGWYFHKAVSSDSSTVQYVTVENTTFNHNNLKGIYAEKLEDATFTDTVVSGNGFRSAIDLAACAYFQPWQSGVDINLKAGTYQNIIFANPEIINNGLGAKEGVGLAIKARNDGATYGLWPATLDHVVINNAIVTGNERGIRIGEPGKNNAGPTDVNVYYSNLAGNIKAYSGIDGSAYGGAVNQSLAPFTAEANWWGSNVTADVAAQTSGTIDYTPWLCSGTDTSTDPGFQPSGQTDCSGPVVSNVSVSPSPVYLNAATTLTALADDATTGNSNIASAEYKLNAGSWLPMLASDGIFDEPSETLTANFTASTFGSNQVCVRATDFWGNISASTCSAAFTVGYKFTGFFQPVDMNAVNIAKAGQAIPVKWRLTDANGVPISDPASFVGLYSYSVSCSDFNGTPPDAIETYSGSSGLQYLGDGYWQFNWKTPKTYANTCRVMYVQFQGGFKSPEVDFKFKP